jgi:hypothetical protein
MPKDPRKTWEYFARAAIHEQDPEKLSCLIRELYRALDEDENEPERKPPKAGKAA